MLPDAAPVPTRKKSETGRNLTELSQEEIQKRLLAQESNPFHAFVEGNLILKQGKRQLPLLLTLGN